MVCFSQIHAISGVQLTTLAILATKDAVVMGCDSLGSMTKELVDPFELIDEYFDPKDDFKLKVDSDGKPLLKEFSQIYREAQLVPFNHMTHVEKLFSLKPLSIGVMFTGIATIGDRTVRSLINEFREEDKAFDEKSPSKNYTVKSLAGRLLKHIRQYYDAIHGEKRVKPPLELIIGGYNKTGNTPHTFRIYVHTNEIEPCMSRGNFGIAFGAQREEIQRLVFGTDQNNWERIVGRMDFLYGSYRDRLHDFLKANDVSLELPEASSFGSDLFIFNEFYLNGFDANWSDFSEQNAIECINFFVEIMVRSQQFSARMPTVDGPIHVALITKDLGVNFVSKETYDHEGFETPKGV